MDDNREVKFVLTKKFEKALKELPPGVKKIALDAVRHPHRPPFQLKKLGNGPRLKKGSWRVRVTNQNYRAIAQVKGDVWTWYWIGTHEAYNGMVGK
jgi:mRNA-degrading endonuclease RelE of RelBE toxin-antitoxin system